MDRLRVPVAYMGGKQRLAPVIVDHILSLRPEYVYDLCCGSGAISIELVSRGFDPARILMMDAGPWGAFWEQVGSGTFDLAGFEHLCGQIPTDQTAIKPWMEARARLPVPPDFAGTFLVLQSASFGGKPIWTEDGRWQTPGFKAVWSPTPTSIRRHPTRGTNVAPMELLSRVKAILPSLRGVQARQADARKAPLPAEGSVVYIDPPYRGTTGYSTDFDAASYARSLTCPILVSEAAPLNESATCLTKDRKQAGVAGGSKPTKAEWLSFFNTPQRELSP